MPDSSLPSSMTGGSSDRPDIVAALDAERRRCDLLIQDARQSRRDLEERLQFEQLLGDICSNLINVNPDELFGRIDVSLRTLVEFFGIDRSSLAEFSDDSKLRSIHSWARPGLEALGPYEPLDTLYFYLDRLRHGNMVVISRLDDLPVAATHEREYCLRTGIKSHVGIPLMIGGDFVGAIGFTFLRQEHQWSADILGRLRLVGEAFTNALLRQRWNQQQQELSRILERQVAQRTAIAESRSAQLRRLTMQMDHVAHRERRRIALVLHEGLQQLLVGAKLALASPPIADFPQQSDEINAMLDEAIRISRSLTVELYPPVLYDFGLVPALRWLGPHMKSKYDLQVDMRLEDKAEPASQELREFLFEATRELLFNVLHHAGTQTATVILEKPSMEQIRLSVLDQGIGFEPTKLDELDGDAFGLFSLRERLVLLGGKMHITSRPREGTCVTILLPLSPSPRG